jgi:predicted SprT family Zn-dependent metalloprotease
MDNVKISHRQYGLLQRAFDHFNRHLFGSELPQVIITLSRHKKALGYFSPKRFTLRQDNSAQVHEIAMNPDYFRSEITTERSLSTLVHEMTHLWQEEFGKNKPRKAYHNREWADKMEALGLMPSSTGANGGKRTGQKCSHYIMQGGAFAHVAANFLAEAHDALLINAKPVLSGLLAKKAAKKNKVCYRCKSCGQKAWAKPSALLMCGQCQENMPAGENL